MGKCVTVKPAQMATVGESIVIRAMQTRRGVLLNITAPKAQPIKVAEYETQKK